jgi:hypothetical protein
MQDDQRRRQVHSAATQPPTTFTTSVAPTDRGEWLTIVELGDGVSLTKLFDEEDEARRYGADLAAWLRPERSE